MTSVSTDRRQGVNAGAAIKVPCDAASTGALTLSGEQTVDGVACVTGDRVLVKNQASGVDNGIYVVDTGAWSRALDFDGIYDVVQGTMVMITGGTTQDNTYWRVSTANPITLETTALTFEQALTTDLAVTSFLQAGTGAVVRTGQDKMRDIVSVLDFFTATQAADVKSFTGAVDVTAAIQAAIDTMANNAGTLHGGIVYNPPGKYKIATGPLMLYDHVRLEGSAGNKGRWYSVPAVKGTTYQNDQAGDTLRFFGGGNASLSSGVSAITFDGSNTGAHIRLLDSVVQIRIHDCGFFNKQNGILARTVAAGTVTDYYVEIDHNSFDAQTAESIRIYNAEGYSWKIHHNHMRGGAAEAIKATSGFFLEQIDIHDNEIEAYQANNIKVIHLEDSSGSVRDNWLFCVVPATFTNKDSYGIGLISCVAMECTGNTIACGHGVRCESLTDSHIGINEVGCYSSAQTGAGADNNLLSVDASCEGNIFDPQCRPVSQPTVGVYNFQNPDNYIRTQDFGQAGGGRSVNFAQSPYTCSPYDRFIGVDATGGAVTIVLPTLTNDVHANNIDITIVKYDGSGNAVTVDGAGAQTINGAANAALAAQYNFKRFQSLNTNWYITAVG